MNYMKTLRTKRFFTLSLVMIISILLLLILQVALPENNLEICKNNVCSKKTSIVTTSLVENANLNFLIANSDLQLSPVAYTLTNSHIELNASQTSIQVELPMRYGESLFFPIDIGKVRQGDLISIRIENSQTFMVFKNNIIFYTHRYQAPIFFVSPENPFSLNVINNASNLQSQITLKSENSKKTDLVLLLAIIFALGSGIFASTFIRPRKEYFVKINIPVAFVVSCVCLWIFSLLKWFSKPFDLTGVGKQGPFGPSGPFFSDIFQVFQSGRYGTPFTATDYPPFAVALGRITQIISPTIFSSFILGVTVFLFASTVVGFSVANSKKKIVLLALLGTSYPLVFGLLRGNLDLLAIALTLFSIWLFMEEMTLAASIVLAFAVALKFWPIIFIIIFIKRKEPLKALITVMCGGFLTLASSVLLGYHQFSKILEVSTKSLTAYGTSSPDISSLIHSYSLMGLTVGLLLLFYAHSPSTPTRLEMNHIYAIAQGNLHYVILALAAVSLLYLIFRFKTTSSIFLVCSSSVLLLTSVSYVYRAGILIACLVIRMLEPDGQFFRFSSDSKIQKNRSTFFNVIRITELMAWAVIFAPTDFSYVTYTFYSWSSVLQPLAVIILIIVEFNFVKGKLLAQTPSKRKK